MTGMTDVTLTIWKLPYDGRFTLREVDGSTIAASRPTETAATT